MKVAIISDIHSNLEALRAFLTGKEKYGWEKVYCLGDIVGYGPNPNECIDLLRDHGAHCVLGNHDAMALEIIETRRASQVARDGIAWTRRKLTRDSIAYLRDLPRIIRDHELLFIHASIYSLEEYVRSITRAEVELKGIRSKWPKVKVAFYGHTHQQALFDLNGTTSIVPVANTALQVLPANHVYLVNPGSIGQSRSTRPEVAFATFDRSSGLVNLHTIAYEYKQTARKMATAGLKASLYRTRFMRFKRKLRRLLGK